MIVPLTAEVTTCELMLAARCMAGLRSYTAASYLEVRSKYVQPREVTVPRPAPVVAVAGVPCMLPLAFPLD